MTNFEKIKSMSIEEMAEFLQSIYKYNDGGKPILSYRFGHNDKIKEIQESYGDIKEWLESEVE